MSTETTYTVDYSDETGAQAVHTFGTDRAAAQAMLDRIAGTEYAGDVTAADMHDVTEPWDEARGVRVRAVTATGYDDERGNWSVMFVETYPIPREAHIARHSAGRTKGDGLREHAAIQTAALGYHLTPRGRHAKYRTFNPREAVGPAAPGIVRRLLVALNGGAPSSHSEPDRWDMLTR